MAAVAAAVVEAEKSEQSEQESEAEEDVYEVERIVDMKVAEVGEQDWSGEGVCCCSASPNMEAGGVFAEWGLRLGFLQVPQHRAITPPVLPHFLHVDPVYSLH